MGSSTVVTQFTGGKDSTLLALLMTREFERVHLLTFAQPLLVELEKAAVNVRKLRLAFGEERFEHSIIDIGELLGRIYQGSYVRHLMRYKTYHANNFCGACRLAMISHTVIYCLRNSIEHVRDGSNATGFDLSQQSWALDRIREFYAGYGIDYGTPIYDVERADIELLKLSVQGDPPMLLHRSQPRCRGGGAFHNIYLRCYFLPIHGRNAYRRVGSQWLEEKLQFCGTLIKEVCGV